MHLFDLLAGVGPVLIVLILAGGLDRADIGRIQQPRDSDEIAIRDIGAKRRMPPQRFGSGNCVPPGDTAKVISSGGPRL